MTTLSRDDRWAAFAVGAFTASVFGGMSWLIGGALIPPEPIDAFDCQGSRSSKATFQENTRANGAHLYDS
jgi:hypothetical protein